MTKMHFEEAARIVKRTVEGKKGGYYDGEPMDVANAFVTLFEAFNPRFNREKFLKASGL